jgi:hypothetical protein
MSEPVEITPSEFFGGIDFTATPEESKDKPKETPFTAIEQHLHIPEGSTEEALAAVKQQTKAFRQQVASVKTAADGLVAKEKMANAGYLTVTEDVLKSDRDRIREEAFAMYESGKEMFEVMKERFLTTIQPTDRMCTAVATMLNSMSQSLDKLLKVNISLREETEHYKDKHAEPEVDENGDAQEYEFNPENMYKLIEKWTAEGEAEIAKQIEVEAGNRIGMEKHDDEESI